jgi:hypothetical protein
MFGIKKAFEEEPESDVFAEEKEECPEDKPLKSVVPLYNIDYSKYPDKNRLNMAIKKTNKLFESDDDNVIEDMDIDYENEDNFWNADGNKNYQAIYNFQLERNYRQPKEDEWE